MNHCYLMHTPTLLHMRKKEKNIPNKFSGTCNTQQHYARVDIICYQYYHIAGQNPVKLVYTWYE